jgi:hypothetical protein
MYVWTIVNDTPSYLSTLNLSDVTDRGRFASIVTSRLGLGATHFAAGTTKTACLPLSFYVLLNLPLQAGVWIWVKTGPKTHRSRYR